MIGGIVGLLISGEYLSVSAIVGFIAIFAIAILNGIVLVSFIDELRKKFPTVKTVDLVKDATLLRLRPVLMTAFTTLFGILPLLYATGVGSEIQYPALCGCNRRYYLLYYPYTAGTSWIICDVFWEREIIVSVD